MRQWKHGIPQHFCSTSMSASGTFHADYGNVEPEATASTVLEYLTEPLNDMQYDGIRLTFSNQLAPRYVGTSLVPQICAHKATALLGNRAIEHRLGRGLYYTGYYSIPGQRAVMVTFAPKSDFTASKLGIVVVIDRSESMSDELEQEKKALGLTLKFLPLTVKFNLRNSGIARAGGKYSQTVALGEKLDKKVLRRLKGFLTSMLQTTPPKLEFGIRHMPLSKSTVWDLLDA
ncbi:hypothetical protein KEM54_003024 [Ascosphaera aggregata]|nr:hypothetical protein KEM54_003024 [Ascosphaera aggregata]